MMSQPSTSMMIAFLDRANRILPAARPTAVRQTNLPRLCSGAANIGRSI